MPGAKSDGTLEELLGHNGKEFGRVRRAIGVEKCGRSRFIRGPQRLELSAHHARPGQIFGPARQRRRAVGRVILEVELMGELVPVDILAVRRMGTSAYRRYHG